MSSLDHLNTTTGVNAGSATVDAERLVAPKLLLGLVHGDLARDLENHYRGLGWRVCSADCSKELRRVAFVKHATAVVLPVQAFRGESGFLTCAKLVAALPKTRVVLVGPASEEMERFALFAGAAGYAAETDGATAVIRLINGTPRTAIG
jgi:hypothetical protein